MTDPAQDETSTATKDLCSLCGSADTSADHPCVLTGQVPAWPDCPKHRETSHGLGGRVWCNRCGWNRFLGEKLGRANGGWA